MLLLFLTPYALEFAADLPPPLSNSQSASPLPSLIHRYALYPRLGLFSVPMTGVIALFYRGLLELSKSFLDPFGNRCASANLLPISPDL